MLGSHKCKLGDIDVVGNIGWTGNAPNNIYISAFSLILDSWLVKLTPLKVIQQTAY